MTLLVVKIIQTRQILAYLNFILSISQMRKELTAITANERRTEIMRILVARKKETMSNLAFDLGVSVSTIQRDIIILTADYPLETVRGNGGCVKVPDGYLPNKHILTMEQQIVLMQMCGKADEHEKKILREIIAAYGSPVVSEDFQNRSPIAEKVPMTVKELSQMRYLAKEIKQDERRLAKLEAAAATAEITGRYNDLIAGIKAVIESKKESCMKEYDRLARYITSIDNSFIRQILTYRYVNGFTWVQVAVNIGGGNTEDSVRKAHERFLAKQK